MMIRPTINRALLLGAVTLFAAACGDSPQLPTDGESSVEQVQARSGDVAAALVVHERHTTDLMNIEGVVGTGLGVTGGEPRIRVYTLHGNVRGIPGHVDNVPIERVVTGLIVAGDINDPSTKERPAPNGFSVGHPDITAGTLGAIVRDESNACFALSNNHVLANSNDASLGDSALQPGPFDGGSEADAIGTLAAFEPIAFDGSNNTIDAAIAALFSTAAVTGSTPDFAYGAPGTNPVDATVGMDVMKFGRTTGFQTGTVEEVNVTVDVCYETRGPFRCVSLARFVDQISISDGSFSDGGDSGSLIVRQSDKSPVGLLFAGSTDRTLANPIGDVLTRFGVVVEPNLANCDGAAEPPPDDGGDDPPAADFSLSATGFKVRGVQHADLSWDGATSTDVDILRDGAVVATTGNDGAHTDDIGLRGSGSYVYQVCEAGTSTCSNEASVVF